MNPPVAAAVFAVDEKPQSHALNRTAPTLPMLPSTPAQVTHDYERNGTCELFAALEIATGKVITDIRARHTSADFIAFLNKVDREVPKDLDVHVILDNLSTHKTPTVHKWLLRQPRRPRAGHSYSGHGRHGRGARRGDGRDQRTHGLARRQGLRAHRP